MTTTVKAIYEQGVLRLQEPISLPDGAQVDVTVISHEEDNNQDSDGMEAQPGDALTQLIEEYAIEPEVPDRASPSAHLGGRDEQIRQRRMEWLKLHREEFAGQYVALNGEVLVGHGVTIREAHQQAKEKGVEKPFLVHLTSENEVLFAGW